MRSSGSKIFLMVREKITTKSSSKIFHECKCMCLIQASSYIHIPLAEMAKHPQRCEAELAIKCNLRNHCLSGNPDCLWCEAQQGRRNRQQHFERKPHIAVLPLSRQLDLEPNRRVQPGFGESLGSRGVWILGHGCSVSVAPSPDSEVHNTAQCKETTILTSK